MKTNHDADEPKNQRGLMIAALGVVFGDIGTSPLYALRQCFQPGHHFGPEPDNVMGVLSLIVWSLTILVCIKYLFFLMRMSSQGEGGILTLLALAGGTRAAQARTWLIFIGILGGALFYSDGIITPAISVLGAVEGLGVAMPGLTPLIAPLTALILVGLFAQQRRGTDMLGRMFGPIMVVWFVTLALLGLRGITLHPQVLAAVNPWFAVRFLSENGVTGFAILGSVFLVVTGSEALYADMGHFGIRPIRLGWCTIVFPALLLNYFGQGALLISNPEAMINPFFSLAPNWAQFPLVVLATAAAVIASQSLITGSFSITMQAIQLGLLPRMQIKHTSSSERGQIYMPLVNWALMLACVGLVLSFRSSNNLAGAYGIAVTMTMALTSLLFFMAARRVWRWPFWKAGLLCAFFFTVEGAFLSANSLKLLSGGWFPLVVATGLFVVMTTWRAGRTSLHQRLSQTLAPWPLFLDDIRAHPPCRVPGTAVFLSGNPHGVPMALLHNLKHNRVLHQRVVVLHLSVREEPFVEDRQRAHVEELTENVYRVTGQFGFMEEPNVSGVLAACALQGLKLDLDSSSFFLSRESMVRSSRPILARWRVSLFAFLSRNAQPPTAFFGLPSNRVVELGMQVEL